MASTRPLVSIGIPVYNRERVLARTLESILAQTSENLEVVISDNASTDGTRDICEQFAARDSRIEYYRNATNIGLTKNFRRVLTLATGQYFAWTASDDTRPADAIAEAVSAFAARPDAVMVHGPVALRLRQREGRWQVSNAFRLDDSDAARRIDVFTREYQHNGMLFGVYARAALQRVVFGAHYGQDYLVCLRACQLGPVAYVDTPLILYCDRGEQISLTPMYRRVPLTLKDLLFYQGVRQKKAWVVLLRGCYYLAADAELPRSVRARTVNAHVRAFVARYRRELTAELAFLAVTPVRWIAAPFRPAAIAVAGLWRRRGARGPESSATVTTRAAIDAGDDRATQRKP